MTNEFLSTRVSLLYIPSRKPLFHTSSAPNPLRIAPTLLKLEFELGKATTVTGTRPLAEPKVVRELKEGTVTNGVAGT